MKILSLIIRNFKSIRELQIGDIENAMILVGKNNTGKTVVLDAIRAVTGSYIVKDADFNIDNKNIGVSMCLELTEEDLRMFHGYGLVSGYKKYELWLQDFMMKLPSYENNQISFTCIIDCHKNISYYDGHEKNNKYIKEILPRMYVVDTSRSLKSFQEDLLMFQESEQLIKVRSNVCMFDMTKTCNKCFHCIGVIKNKKAEELELHETARLLEYKMYELNLHSFSERINANYHKNGGFEQIQYTLSCNRDELFQIKAEAWHEEQKRISPVEQLGNGMKSIYMLSLLETYIEDEKSIPSIIIVEYPELFLHPSLQKNASRILYQLSKKNQVFFSTHSPNMVANFTRKQLCQIVTDKEGYSVARQNADIDEVLNDLGYSANDLMNVDFVFIVEGKQDKSRFPLLLEKYYSDMYDEHGELSRISIITTNSCTNIKTYANLKYMNQLYLRDQFLMVRDSDGKNPEQLGNQLCRYYSERSRQDGDKIPRVNRENVLILKYYSFENYFLNPKVMEKIGVIKNEEEFWKILLSKWKQYLFKLSCGRHLTKVLGKRINTIKDLKENFEEFKIYMRGHNLYDIFYGRYKKEERELLRRYLEYAPREDFADILEAIDAFPFFDSRRKENVGDAL